MLCINLFSFRFSLELILAPVALVFLETVQIPMHVEDKILASRNNQFCLFAYGWVIPSIYLLLH